MNRQRQGQLYITLARLIAVAILFLVFAVFLVPMYYDMVSPYFSTLNLITQAFVVVIPLILFVSITGVLYAGTARRENR